MGQSSLDDRRENWGGVPVRKHGSLRLILRMPIGIKIQVEPFRSYPRPSRTEAIRDRASDYRSSTIIFGNPTPRRATEPGLRNERLGDVARMG